MAKGSSYPIREGAFYHRTAVSELGAVHSFGVHASTDAAVVDAVRHNSLDYGEEWNEKLRLCELFQARGGRLITVALFTGPERSVVHRS